jgi:hypothetical protein
VDFTPSTLNEIVLFELPAKRAAERLVTHIGTGRLVWLQSAEGPSVVGALLSPNPDDLAQLLRGVQAWLDRSGLPAIRFEIDGRTYVLDARQAALASG